MRKQDEQEEQDRKPDTHPERTRGIPGAPFVTHHEEQSRAQARQNAQKDQTDGDFHREKYRMHLRQLIPTLAALVVIAITASLGRWQLQRADDKARAGQLREAALARSPVELSAGSRADHLDAARVVVQGEWVDEKTIFLDNRTRQGVAGFHVVTPLQLGSRQPAVSELAGTSRSPGAMPPDSHVLVLRGWVARDVSDRTRLPRIVTPPGPVRIEGLGMAELAQPMRLATGQDVDPATPRIWQHLDPQVFARWSGLPLHGLMLRQLSEADDGLKRDWTLPGSGEDKHRAYAFQWFAMSAVTALLWIGLTLRRRGRSRPLEQTTTDSTGNPPANAR